jgi:hypothetical protein
MYTTPKPSGDKQLPLDVWTTVTILNLVPGYEQIVYDYVRVFGKLKAGHEVGKVRIRALRDGHTEFLADGKTKNPKFDETANHDVAVVADYAGNFTWCVPTPWIGARRQDSLHWQVKPSMYVASGSAASSRHAANMSNLPT